MGEDVGLGSDRHWEVCRCRQGCKTQGKSAPVSGEVEG